MSRRLLLVAFLAVTVIVGGGVAATEKPAEAEESTSPLLRGSRQWDVAAIDSDIVGTGGPLYRFNVKTEVELGYEADQFAREALAILGDQRSWIGQKNVRF